MFIMVVVQVDEVLQKMYVYGWELELDFVYVLMLFYEIDLLVVIMFGNVFLCVSVIDNLCGLSFVVIDVLFYLMVVNVMVFVQMVVVGNGILFIFGV